MQEATKFVAYFMIAKQVFKEAVKEAVKAVLNDEAFKLPSKMALETAVQLMA